MDGRTITYIGRNYPLTKHDNNANIKIHIFDEDIMRKARFTDYREGYWYFCKDLRPLAHGISFNLSIKKDDPTEWRIDVLDEAFCQPYDYQSMIDREMWDHENFDGSFHWRVDEMVVLIMEHLVRLGVISGWKKGDYI